MAQQGLEYRGSQSDVLKAGEKPCNTSPEWRAPSLGVSDGADGEAVFQKNIRANANKWSCMRTVRAKQMGTLFASRSVLCGRASRNQVKKSRNTGSKHWALLEEVWRSQRRQAEASRRDALGGGSQAYGGECGSWEAVIET